VTIDGGTPSAGDPSGSDRLVVETPGAAAETAEYTPSASDGGTLDLTSLSSLLTISKIEELLYDGEADNDSLTVIGTGVDDVITHSPGSTNQSGEFQVNGLLPIDYQNLGAGGSLAADGARRGPRSSTSAASTLPSACRTPRGTWRRITIGGHDDVGR
jgi:hypothetical protein